MSPLSCQRCKQTSNGPQAFLLTCRGCSKTWHHRCHMPPVEDTELLQLIRATNAKDTANDLSTWACRRCSKKATSGTPSAMSSREPTVSSDSHEQGMSSTRISSFSPAISTSTSTASVASTVEVRVAQDSSTTRLPTSVSEAPPHVRPGSSTNERERDVRPADGTLNQSQDAAGAIDDDPDDLYGPPVERRVIRILPSLAQELREQQVRVAAEKEKQRAPLAPDWIIARHVHDPLWKAVPSEGRRRRKPSASRKLGDNGLDVNELIGCFTIQNWVREHKS